MSEEKSLEDRIKQIIVDNLNVKVEQITPEAKFIEDLGADSLDTVELVMALEEEFDVTVEEEELEGVTTIGGAYGLIVGKL